MKRVSLFLLAAAFLTPLTQARPRFIHPGVPRIYPGDQLIVPTSFPLIPRSRPVLHPRSPNIHPGDRLIVPTSYPLVPTTHPSAPGAT